MGTVSDKILDRIKKLHAQAASAESIGSHDEAATFAAAVQRLCERYHLSIDEVDLEGDQMRQVAEAEAWIEEGPTRRTWWSVELGVTVADAHNCISLGAPGTTITWFVGRRLDRECAVWVYTVLFRYMMKNAQVAYGKARRNGADTGGFYTQYYKGFLAALQSRYAEEARRRRRYVDPDKALALVKPDEEIKAFLADTGVSDRPAEAGPKRPSVNIFGAGWQAGFNDGNSAPIRSRGLDGDNNSEQRELGNG